MEQQIDSACQAQLEAKIDAACGHDTPDNPMRKTSGKWRTSMDDSVAMP
eukprot:SAG22_NODE_505_length_9680_cov_10.482831_6_plen_49_part_00